MGNLSGNPRTRLSFIGHGNNPGGNGGNGNGGLGGSHGGGNPGNGGGPPVPVSNIFSAYGLTRLVSNYTGALLRVRRSSDDTEQDIPQTATKALDTVSLLSFVGAGNGFVTKWYDQSGAGNDFSQSTTTKQPQLVLSGTYLGEILWDGTDDYLVTPNTPDVNAFTLIYAGRQRIGAQGGITPFNETIWGHTSGTTVWASRNPLYTNIPQTFAETKLDGVNLYSNAQAKDGSVYAARFDISQASLATQVTTFVDGIKQTRSGTGAVSSISSGTYGVGVWVLGGDAASAYSRFAARSVLIYTAAVTDANILSTSTLLMPTVTKNVFDSNTTGLWGLYSLRRQLSAYSGSSIKVRRSSDSTEQDIGFINDSLDTAALLTFCGAGDGFISKFYDQSGAGNDFAQTTTTKQPKIVASGVLNAYGMLFDGVDDCLTTAASGTATNKFTVFLKAEMVVGSLPASGCIIENGTVFNTNKGIGAFFATSQTQLGSGNTTTDYSLLSFNVGPVRQVMTFTWDRSVATNTAQNVMFSGGKKFTVINNNSGLAGAGIGSGNVTAAGWNLGSRNNGASAPTTISVDTVAIYDSVIVSDANIELISRKLG